MAVSMRSTLPAVSQQAPRSRCVVVRAGDNKVQIAVATIAAAALLNAPQPAQAGVVLQNQPQVKKLFQADGTPQPVKERAFRLPGAPSAPGTKAEAPKPKAVSSSSSGGLDPRSIALPGAIAAIGGLGFAFSKVDSGFTEWFAESGALVRNSGNYAGFEEEIKAVAGDVTQRKTGTTKVKAGTKKIKK